MPININNSFIALETNKDKIDIKNVFINIYNIILII